MPSTSTLDPAFRPMADELLRVARIYDARFVITSARRSRMDQIRLYNQWMHGKSPFPALPPGKSQHERGLAVDMMRLGVDPADDPLLSALGDEWRRAGGVYGGTVDPVHFEAPARLTGRGSTPRRARRRRR